MSSQKDVFLVVSGGTQKVGVKKALVFYGGKPPKGAKTNWIMHEYRLADNNNNKTVAKPAGFDPTNKKASLRLDDWVLCRIYKKNNLQRPVDSDGSDHTMTPAGMMLGSIPPSISGFNPTVEVNHDHRTMLNSSNVNMITTSNFLPVKRSLPGLFWNEEGHTKRLLSESNSNGNNVIVTRNSDENGGLIGSLLSQFPQMPQMHHQQAMLGSIGVDGVYRQPCYQLHWMNWYS